ncbi:MAG: transposase-like protein [Bacteroidia bacterium]|jgi:transposase-like protein
MDNKTGLRKRFTAELRRLVVKEYLSGGITQAAILKKYQIKNVSAITKWRREFGYSDEVINFRDETYHQMSKNFQNNFDSTNPSEDKSSLEKENEDLRLQLEYYKRVIRKAEEQFKIRIEKKSGTK